ncbi:MAG TPA: hypothetical protein VGQ57_11695 [Polyangiaceae bacterium]|jgi:hypothetical protein|nr:hypothetical protein [Polyangiaceae bacterium]
MAPKPISLALAALALSGCLPDFVDDTTRVTAPRVLAVQAEPAEAKESETVTLTALVADAPGSDTGLPAWSLCIDRKPLSELGPVSTRCLAGPSPGADVALPVDAGPPAQAKLPEDACQLFGPSRPEPKPGQPSGRPVDPDPTGGFYQPVLAWLGAEPVLGGVRLACELVGAPPAITQEYHQRYTPNKNPELHALEALRNDGSIEVLSEPDAHVFRPHERLRLRVTWPDCPEMGECGGAERYAVYDALSQTLLERTESFVVSWYGTSGAFAEPRTERAFGDAGEPQGTLNTWTAPASGAVEIWAVAHDDRGGQSWARGSLSIEP